MPPETAPTLHAVPLPALGFDDGAVGGFYTAVQQIRDGVTDLIAAIPHDYTESAQAGAKHALEAVLILLSEC